MDERGTLTYVSRREDCVRYKIYDEAIFPQPIENAVKQHTDVTDAMVMIYLYIFSHAQCVSVTLTITLSPSSSTDFIFSTSLKQLHVFAENCVWMLLWVDLYQASLLRSLYNPYFHGIMGDFVL